ncbi:MAG: acyl carrier protein [Anaerolineae bacterium]|nr:acyl carrier protein [Gemmatimonadaceae bacterium]
MPEANVTGISQTSQQSWDSLAHVLLVAAIESEFGITLDAADQLRMPSFEATQLLLEEKGL